MKTLLTIVALSTAPLAGCAVESDSDTTETAGFAISVVPGGTTCAQLGLGAQEFRIETPVSGVYSIDAGNSLTFGYYDDTNTVFFYTNSSLRMDGVLVHSGDTSTVWELPGANGWPSLGAFEPGVDGYIPTDAVSFCFDYELFLNPNAYGHYATQHSWDIAKTGQAGAITMGPGETFAAEYQVTVTPAGQTAGGLFFEGPVFVNNPTPFSPLIESVSVMVGEIVATVTCPVELPYTLPAFTTLTCSFAAEMPDDADRLVFVDVVSDGTLAIDRSLELASFSDHTTSLEELDECVRVYDDHVAGELLGTVCAADGARTFTYTAAIGPFAACGPFDVVNTAWYAGIDTGASESASWSVGGEVPCAGGCTRTQGYWSTHSEYGPARYDSTWASLPSGADTIFFLSGRRYLDVLAGETGGNAYLILAQQYIAAQLNQLSGASLAPVAAAFDEATALFGVHRPTSPAVTKKSSSVRARFIALAEILDAYNNGVTGPGHCG
jgi:hypothetical protein